MCEWLSFGEWCDVKLLCGGRAFNAHRAVLASVSSFLRRLLLSCPDESPTFIVLPEFDLDAMSSVLYYIYNGEVTVQKQKLNLFLDIINALQIFIDSQYLSLIADNDNNYSVLESQNDIDLTKRNIFTLGSQETKDQVYVNLKKGKEIHDVVLKKSLSISEYKDSLICNQNPSEEHKSSFLGNLKSPYGDRQMNSFLRDLFIETYPRNGNVNGLTTGVLAISNECYHAPASVLLTNANGSHLSVDDILLKPYEKTSERICYSDTVFHLHEQKRCTPSGQDYNESSKSFYDLSIRNVNKAGQINNFEFETRLRQTLNNDCMSRIPVPSDGLIQIGLQEKLLSGLYLPPVNVSGSPSIFNTVTSNPDYRNTISVSGNSTALTNATKERCKDFSKESTAKNTILNYVLDNPWSPRTPQTFKPFRRKFESKSVPEVTIIKAGENTIGNDSNNNVDKKPLSSDLIKTEELMGAATNIAPVSQATLDVLCFKCIICDQVFATRDLLSVHMRRHSSNARYTCSECSKTFSQLRNFKYHMSIHRGTREFAATCTVCGKYFNDRGYLSSHMKIHRNRKEYKCTLCPKSFNQRVAYNMHVRIHTGVKPHVCEQCGKAFSRKMLLKQHQRTHSGERPYACPHCDKRFADRSNMTLHLRLHTGIKPFSCNLCPKSFTKKHHLKSHLNFHTGSKPYSCPRCKLAFTQSSNMRTHLKKCRAPEPLMDSETSQTP